MVTKKIIKLQTPSQTIGPFFAYGLTPEQYQYDFASLANGQMVPEGAKGEMIYIKGSVFDGEGKSIEDAMLELWQDDGENPLFGRYGTGTEADNGFTFTTVKPKSINGGAPYIHVILFMRGQLLHSYTRIYFSDETELNQSDALLQLIEEDRKSTLIAEKKGNDYVFNIHMQGPKETVFFAI